MNIAVLISNHFVYQASSGQRFQPNWQPLAPIGWQQQSLGGGESGPFLPLPPAANFVNIVVSCLIANHLVFLASPGRVSSRISAPLTLLVSTKALASWKALEVAPSLHYLILPPDANFAHNEV